MFSRFLFAALCAFSCPVIAQTPPATPPVGPASDGIKLHVARNGSEVMITWELPPLEIRQFEIYRNTRATAPGRTRAAAVRTEPAIYLDQVADETITYWYWLKITLANGQTIGAGPVATPDAKVWAP